MRLEVRCPNCTTKGYNPTMFGELKFGSINVIPSTDFTEVEVHSDDVCFEIKCGRCKAMAILYFHKEDT